MSSSLEEKSDDGSAPSTGGPDPSASHSISAGSFTAPPTTPGATNASRSWRKTSIQLPNIVVTPAVTNLRAKRRLSGDSNSDASPPQKQPPTKRTRSVASKDNDKIANNELRASKMSSAIYPSPVSAIFPPTAFKEVPPALQTSEFDDLRGDLDHFETTAAPSTAPLKPKQPFQMFNEFMKHPELILNLATVMHPTSLIDLYAISKPFHFILNSHYTTYMKANMDHHAPNSHLIFPWRCYGRITIKDPGWRPMHASNPDSVARDVPSLRWLLMVTYRDEVIRDILLALSKHGLLLPHGIEKAVKKMWFICDLPGNANRIGVLHNTGYLNDRDIFLAQMFIMKLDMRFTDPVEGTGETNLRKLLFGCRNLVPMRDLLLGRISLVHLLQRVVWYQYNPSARTQPILGIAPNLIGNGNTEHWGRGTQRLLRVDEGILREAIRRDLNTHKHFIHFMLFAHQELGVKQGAKSEMIKLKGLPRLDFRKGRAARIQAFEFYIWGYKKKGVMSQPQQPSQLQIPSQQRTMASVRDEEELKGEELEEDSGDESGSSQ